MPNDNDQILCNYQKGEERGVGLLRSLQNFAPNSQVAAEIGDQIIDEMKHDRLFSTRLKDLDIDCLGMNNSLEAVYDLADDCVARKDWVESITIQTIIEELAMATFTEHLRELDEKTQVVLNEIIQDEARHLQFGIRELKKIADDEKYSTENREKIHAMHQKVLTIFRSTFKDNSYTPEEHAQLIKTVTKAYKMHRQRLAVIGIEIPKID